MIHWSKLIDASFEIVYDPLPEGGDPGEESWGADPASRGADRHHPH